VKARLLWIALLVEFAALNVYLLSTHDWAGILTFLGNLGPWGTLAVVDLLIALGIGIAWMWRDARLRGIAPLPYAALTVFTGSLGMLAYLVRYGLGEAPSAASGRNTSASMGCAPASSQDAGQGQHSPTL
jgi:hypothetical protein